METSGKKLPKALYVSYNGITEPVFQSQGLSYLKGLNKRGLEFILLTFEKENINKEAAGQLLNGYRINWYKLRYHKRPRLFSKVWDILLGNIYVIYLAFIYRVKIIHARGVIPAAMSFFASCLMGKKFICDIRSSLADAYASDGVWAKKWLIYKLVKSLERFYILHSHSAIVETSLHAKEIARICGKADMPPIEVIPCCVDLNRFNYSVTEKGSNRNLNKREFKLLYIGSLSGWYMPDEMLNFFLCLKEISANAKFIFLINNGLAQLADRVKKNKPLSDSVKVESVNFEELPAKFMEMDAGIVFTKPNARLASMPIKIGEYLASGLPVVLSRGMGDAEELIERNNLGVVIERFNNAEYKRGAIRLLSLIKEDSELHGRCRKAAEDYLSLDMGINKYLRIYNQLLPER